MLDFLKLQQEFCEMNEAEIFYKSSFYNLFFDVDDAIILFNSYRGTLIEVPSELQKYLQENEIHNISASIIGDLFDLGFLVHASDDELSQYVAAYEESKNKTGELWLKLFLATSCNLRCHYCYQNAPEKVGKVISKAALERLLRWLNAEYSSGSINVLNLELYGGEPLLASLHLSNFITSLNKISESHGSFVNYSIVTNGTLLNDELIDLFIANKVAMQITLDGDKATHDSRRTWKMTGLGTFDEICRNIEKICAKGGEKLIRLRMNVDQENIQEVGVVARWAKALSISSFTCGRVHFREKNTEYARRMITSEAFEESYDLQIYRILQPLGYADSPCELDPPSTCLFHWKRGFSISPSLELYKCDELIDYPEFCVGYIDANGKSVMHDSEYTKAVSRKPTDFEKCSTCRYLPQCGSGCPIRALNTKGSPHLSFCEASYDSIRRKVATYVRASAEGSLIDS
jgi:uncharacterized protein